MKKTIVSNKIINFSIFYLIILFQIKDILTTNSKKSNSTDSSVRKNQAGENNQNDPIKSDVLESFDGSKKFSGDSTAILNQQKSEEMERVACKIEELEKSLFRLEEKQKCDIEERKVLAESINVIAEDTNNLKELINQPHQPIISEEDFNKLKLIGDNNKKECDNLKLEVSKILKDWDVLLKNMHDQEYVYWIYGGIFFSGISFGVLISAISCFLKNKKNKNIEN